MELKYLMQSAKTMLNLLQSNHSGIEMLQTCWGGRDGIRLLQSNHSGIEMLQTCWGGRDGIRLLQSNHSGIEIRNTDGTYS